MAITAGTSVSKRTGGTATPTTSLGFTATPTTSTQDAFAEFSSIFGPPQSIDPSKVASDVQRLINQQLPPPIVAPTVPRTQIQLPGGTFEGLQQSLFESQFAPVQRELDRQAGAQDNQLSAMLAQAGLADSGTGIGQRAALQDEFGRRVEAAARDISAAATATAFNAQIQVASANAQLDQQRNLAQAGFNLTAQTENARNVLAGNTAAAQAYLTALGLNAEAASAYRNSFLQFLGIQEQARLQGDRLRLEAASTMLNFQLQQRSLDLRQFEVEQQSEIQRLQLAVNREGNLLDFQAALLAAKGQTGLGTTFSLGSGSAGTAFSPSLQQQAIQRATASNLPSLGTAGAGISDAGGLDSFLKSVGVSGGISGGNTVVGAGISDPFQLTSKTADRFASALGF